MQVKNKPRVGIQIMRLFLVHRTGPHGSKQFWATAVLSDIYPEERLSW